MNRYVLSDIYPNIIYDRKNYVFLNTRQVCDLLNKKESRQYEKVINSNGKEVWLLSK